MADKFDRKDSNNDAISYRAVFDRSYPTHPYYKSWRSCIMYFVFFLAPLPRTLPTQSTSK